MTIKHPPVDVAVVGSGMGGAAFCWKLSQRAPQLRIVCLERGDWVKPKDMPNAKPDWQRAAFGAWAGSPNVRLNAAEPAWSADYPIDDTASPIKPLMGNAVGGSTVNWAAHFPRLHPSDFKTKMLDGVGDDWCFSYFDLEPYYDENDRMMGVSGLNGDPFYPPKAPRPMPPLPLGRMGERAAHGFNTLGWAWWPVDAAINSIAYKGRAACNHCGPCQQGCMIHAKASTDVTYWHDAIQQGVELRTRCIVQEIIVQGGRATGVRYRDADGQEHEQPTSFVVVACNGIGTARLLLASHLGGEQVGRNLMFHPVGYVRGVFKEDLDGPAGPIGNALYSHHFYETDQTRGFVRGLQLQVTRENSALIQATLAEPRWGRAAQAQLREEFRHNFRILVMTEDLPESHNRVTLTDKIEADGLPAVKVEYTLSENTQRMLNYGLDRAEEVLRAAGAMKTHRTPLAANTGWHLLGTARMGRDPSASVVDAHGRVHTTPNVIVCDGSIFPTVGAVNPASTIGAVALKLADEFARAL
jgi:choline dehydrogenase-like flavoprotein